MSNDESILTDKINHPSHYTAGSIEVYDFIEAWGLDFAIGNVVKYVTRAPYKGTKLEDLKKAAWYLSKAIQREEKNVADLVQQKLMAQSEYDSAVVNYNKTASWFAKSF